MRYRKCLQMFALIPAANTHTSQPSILCPINIRLLNPAPKSCSELHAHLSLTQSLGVDDLCKLFVNVAIDGFDSKSGDISDHVSSQSGNRISDLSAMMCLTGRSFSRNPGKSERTKQIIVRDNKCSPDSYGSFKGASVYLLFLFLVHFVLIGCS